MQMLQRALGILLAIVMIVLLPAWEKRQQVERMEREWKEILLQRFCEEICMGGVCTKESYLRYSDALQQGSKEYYLQIEEYQKEEGINGNRYWSNITWEEISAELFERGKYSFSGESAIQLLAVAQREEKLFYGRCIRGGDE